MGILLVNAAIMPLYAICTWAISPCCEERLLCSSQLGGSAVHGLIDPAAGRMKGIQGPQARYVRWEAVCVTREHVHDLPHRQDTQTQLVPKRTPVAPVTQHLRGDVQIARRLFDAMTAPLSRRVRDAIHRQGVGEIQHTHVRIPEVRVDCSIQLRKVWRLKHVEPERVHALGQGLHRVVNVLVHEFKWWKRASYPRVEEYSYTGKPLWDKSLKKPLKN
eukprot:3939742-Rhodomonas_salina.1